MAPDSLDIKAFIPWIGVIEQQHHSHCSVTQLSTLGLALSMPCQEQFPGEPVIRTLTGVCRVIYGMKKEQKVVTSLKVMHAAWVLDSVINMAVFITSYLHKHMQLCLPLKSIESWKFFLNSCSLYSLICCKDLEMLFLWMIARLTVVSIRWI